MKNESTLSGLTVANFSKQIDGKETMLCILTNNKGAELTITNYGAKIVSLMVPDRSGKLTGNKQTDRLEPDQSLLLQPIRPR